MWKAKQKCLILGVYQKLFNKMMGCQIDFIVRGIDSKTRSVVASRAQAMLKKRNTFYVELTDEGTHRMDVAPDYYSIELNTVYPDVYEEIMSYIKQFVRP